MYLLFYSGEGDNIRVYVRVRPPDKHLETDVDRTPCLEVTSGNTIVLQSKPDPKNFSFDHVADINTTQVICVVHLGRGGIIFTNYHYQLPSWEGWYYFYQLNLLLSLFFCAKANHCCHVSVPILINNCQ